MKSIDEFTKEELFARVQELEKLTEEYHKEILEQDRLDYAWTGNLGRWYWEFPTNTVTFNPRKVITLGYDPSEVPASATYQYFTDMLHPDDFETAMTAMREHLYGQKEVYETEYRIRTKSGDWKWYHDIGRVTKRSEDGKVLLVAGIVFDITERKEMQAALQDARDDLSRRVDERTAELRIANLELEKASRAKDEFIAAMSHELRTPLTSILGLAEVMQMPHYGTLSEKQFKAVRTIEKSGRRLLDVINDVLDYSKLQSGALTAAIAPCSLGPVCEIAMRAVSALAEKKQQKTYFSISPDEIMLQTDEQLLHRILIHLLNNAIKFTPEQGEYGVEVLGIPEKKQVKITVWDRGIGIQEQDLPRLFQPFVQLDASLARQYEGTGLGLALVEKFAQLLNGSVGVESEFGAGSRFSITLPWMD